METVKYFAYGSNMHSGEMRCWCPSPNATFISIARLANHRLDFTRRSEKRRGGVADIVPAAGQTVWGVLYEVSSADLARLDAKEGARRDAMEGAPNAYERKKVEVIEPMGEQVAAVTYSVVDKEQTQKPHADYMRLLVEGATERGLPDEYVQMLMVVPVAGE